MQRAVCVSAWFLRGSLNDCTVTITCQHILCPKHPAFQGFLTNTSASLAVVVVTGSFLCCHAPVGRPFEFLVLFICALGSSLWLGGNCIFPFSKEWCVSILLMRWDSLSQKALQADRFRDLVLLRRLSSAHRTLRLLGPWLRLLLLLRPHPEQMAHPIPHPGVCFHFLFLQRTPCCFLSSQRWLVPAKLCYCSPVSVLFKSLKVSSHIRNHPFTGCKYNEF